MPIAAVTPSVLVRNTAGIEANAATSTGTVSLRSNSSARSTAPDFPMGLAPESRSPDPPSGPRSPLSPDTPALDPGNSAVEDHRDDAGQMRQPCHLRSAEHRAARPADQQHQVGLAQRGGGQL